MDNSLTGNDIAGRNASRGKPFTEGSLTGQDVRGSAARPGHSAVDGSLTGADIQDHSLTGNDLAGGSVTGATIFGKSITALNIADGTLTGTQIAGNSLTGANIDESSLGTVPNAGHSASADTATSAGNSALLGGLASGAYGVAMRSASQQSSTCASATPVHCAKLTVKVPAGRSYNAIVWSSIAAHDEDDLGNRAVLYCPAARGTCLTASGTFEEGMNVQKNFTETGSAFGTTRVLSGQHLTPGLWEFSTLVKVSFGTPSFSPSSLEQVHTTVLLFDSAVPELPVDPAPGETTSAGSCGSSGASSGESSSGSSGASSSGTSGASSGESSSGSSGASSSGTSGESTSGC